MPIAIVKIGDGARVHAFVHHDVFAADIVSTYRMLLSFLFAKHVENLYVKRLVTLLGQHDHGVEIVIDENVDNNAATCVQARLLRQVLEDGGVLVEPAVAMPTRHNFINEVALALAAL